MTFNQWLKHLRIWLKEFPLTNDAHIGVRRVTPEVDPNYRCIVCGAVYADPDDVEDDDDDYLIDENDH